MCCYSVNMTITKFLQLEFNGIYQEEFIDTRFTNFGEGLVTAFSRYCIVGKFGGGKVWQIDSFQAFGERKFGNLID